jgi:uncharacterized protein HemX
MSHDQDRPRRTIIRLLWLLAVLLAFGIGFGPVYVAQQNTDALLVVQCQLARNQTDMLAAQRLALEGELLIARDLGLPVAMDIQNYLDEFKIPEVPVECEEV